MISPNLILRILLISQWNIPWDLCDHANISFSKETFTVGVSYASLLTNSLKSQQLLGLVNDWALFVSPYRDILSEPWYLQLSAIMYLPTCLSAVVYLPTCLKIYLPKQIMPILLQKPPGVSKVICVRS